MTDNDLSTSKPPDMSDLDWIMTKNPLDLTNDDIDALILQQRNYRAQREAGTYKATRKPTASAPALDLVKLGLKKAAEPVKRRF